MKLPEMSIEQLEYDATPMAIPLSDSDSTAAKIVEALSFVDDVVTFVWVGLTVLMVSSLFLLFRNPEANKIRRRTISIVAVILVIVATWTYPFYAGGFTDVDLVRQLYATYAYSGFLLIVFIVVMSYAVLPALLLFPTFIWLAIAITYVLAQLNDGV